MSKHYIIPVFLPMGGCKNRCIYCNQHSVTGQRKLQLKVGDVVKEWLSYFDRPDNHEVELAFYGGTFCYLPESTRLSLLKQAVDLKNSSIISKIRISTSPDSINAKELSFLKEYGVDVIELGVQSMNNEVLYLNNRPYNNEVVKKAAKKIKEKGFTLGIQIMVGLYGSDVKEDFETGKAILKLFPDFIRIYPCLVLKGTILEELYKKGEYQPLTLESAIRVSSQIKFLMNKQNIKVIRIGLPLNTLRKDIVAGPWHESFHFLVNCELRKQELIALFLKHNIKNMKEVRVDVNKDVLSEYVGYKGQTRELLQKKFNIKKVVFSGVRRYGCEIRGR